VGRIDVIAGDITKLAVDAIVNAANSTLLGGGGVDGAIHRAAGPELRRACAALGGCATGEAVITPGFALPARFVIHTVGPVWRGGGRGEARQLASCHREALRLARERALATVAFPAISCGAYGYPPDAAAEIAVRETSALLRAHDVPERVLFVCFEPVVKAAWERALAGGSAGRD